MTTFSYPSGEPVRASIDPTADPTTPSGPLALTTKGLTRVFGAGDQGVTAVNNVDLEIRSGEFLTVVGRSGSGKTTLLNLLAGLDQPTSGSVSFEGRDLASFSERDLLELRRSKISFIFQSFGLIPLPNTLRVPWC